MLRHFVPRAKDHPYLKPLRPELLQLPADVATLIARPAIRPDTRRRIVIGLVVEKRGNSPLISAVLAVPIKPAQTIRPIPPGTSSLLPARLPSRSIVMKMVLSLRMAVLIATLSPRRAMNSLTGVLEMPPLTDVEDEDEADEPEDDMPPLVDADFDEEEFERVGQFTCEADPAGTAFVTTTFEGRTPSVTLTFMDSVAFRTGSSAVEGKGTFEILGQGTAMKTFRPRWRLTSSPSALWTRQDYPPCSPTAELLCAITLATKSLPDEAQTACMSWMPHLLPKPCRHGPLLHHSVTGIVVLSI